MSQGQQFTKVQYATEDSAYGTEGGTYTELPRVQNINLSAENGIIYDWGLGEGLNASNSYWGPFTASGSVTFNVVDFDFLKHWVGPKTGAGSSGDPYVLTEATNLSVSSSDLQPFSIESLNDDESTNSVDYLLGCCGNTFRLNAEMGERLKCTADFVAQKMAYRTSGESYSANTDDAFIMIGGTWKWGSTPSALSGVQRLSVNYSNGLSTETRSLETRFIGIPKLTKRGYNFEVTIIMANALASTIITNFYGGALTPNDGSTSSNPTANLEFKLEFVNGSKYATIWVDHSSIDRISKPMNVGGGLVQLTFAGTARTGKSNAPINWWTT